MENLFDDNMPTNDQFDRMAFAFEIPSEIQTEFCSEVLSFWNSRMKSFKPATANQNTSFKQNLEKIWADRARFGPTSYN